MRAAAAVSAALLRNWRNGFVDAAGGSRAITFLLVLAAVVIAAVFQVGVFVSTRDLAGVDTGDRSTYETLVKAVILVSMQLSIGVGALLVIVSGDGTRGFRLPLAIAPLSSFARRSVLDVPVIVVATVAGLAGGLPFVVAVGGARGLGSGVLLVACWLAAAVGGALTLIAATRALTWVGMWTLRFGNRAVEPVVISLVVVVFCWQGYIALFGTASSPVSRVYSLVTAGVAEGSWPVLLIPVGGLALVALAWVAGASLGERRLPNVRVPRPSARAARLRAAHRALWRIELLQLVRFPSLVTLLTLNAVLLAVVLARPALRDAVLPLVVPVVMLELPLLVGLFSYAATSRSHWTYRVTSHTPYLWIPAKWAAAAGLTAVLVCAVTALAAVFDQLRAASVAEVALPVALLLTAGLLIGVVFPAGDEQAMSGIAGVTMAAVVGIAGVTVVDRITDPWLGTLATAVAVTAAVLAYRRLVGWRERDAVPMA